MIYLYAALVVLAAALSAIAIRSPGSLALRTSAVVLAGLLMITGYASISDLLGRPKPASLEWAVRNTPEATVLAAELREGEAIYLWLRTDGQMEPRAYVLPWSMDAARQLHEARGTAEKNGTELRVRRPFKSDTELTEPQFYASPHPRLPPKLVSAD